MSQLHQSGRAGLDMEQMPIYHLCINGRQCSCFERFPSVCSEPVLVKPLSFCLFRACLGKHDDHVYIQKSGHKRRCFSYRSPGPPGSSKRSAGSPCHRGVRGCGRRSRGRLRSRSGRRQRRSASSLAPANRTNSSGNKTKAGRKLRKYKTTKKKVAHRAVDVGAVAVVVQHAVGVLEDSCVRVADILRQHTDTSLSSSSSSSSSSSAAAAAAAAAAHVNSTTEPVPAANNANRYRPAGWPVLLQQLYRI